MTPDLARNAVLRRARRVVVKVGSGVLTRHNGLNLPAITAISQQINALIDGGREVILVSSGAMALGVSKLGRPRRPDPIPQRQAVAAVGQAGLIMEYEKIFSQNARKVAQVLLTGDDLASRKRYLNARNTLLTILDWQVIPIINENDTVAVEEIKFGDNDNLSAMITLLMDADCLINLTDRDGLFDQDPQQSPQAKLIPRVTAINRAIYASAGNLPGALGTGGMRSKIKAAQKVTNAGVPMVIAKGEAPDVLTRIFAGEELGTYFVPQRRRLASKKRWLAYASRPQGHIFIDAGAAAALISNGKSLLPGGIVGVEGNFAVGAPVVFQQGDHAPLGVGLVNYSAADIRKIMGRKSECIADCLGYKPYDEVIHRDNLAIIALEQADG